MTSGILLLTAARANLAHSCIESALLVPRAKELAAWIRP